MSTHETRPHIASAALETAQILEDAWELMPRLPERPTETEQLRQLPDADPYPAVEPHAFRAAMGHFATGVAVVGASDRDGVPYGSTANAISSVSLDPPLLLVCMRRESVTLRVLREAGHFGVSMLDAGQAALAERFARSGTPDGWDGIAYHGGAHGAPMIDSALAKIEASIHDVADGGDHVIVIGRTLRVHHPVHHVAPLIFYRGAFAAINAKL